MVRAARSINRFWGPDFEDITWFEEESQKVGDGFGLRMWVFVVHTPRLEVPWDTDNPDNVLTRAVFLS